MPRRHPFFKATSMADYPLLTAGFDLAQCVRLNAEGDRSGYYRYLEAHGSIYAPLARGVVERNDESGTIAIAYCTEYARRRGKTVTDDTLLEINKGLMQLDCEARGVSYRATGVHRELPMAVIRTYHAQVFRSVLGLEPETWTAEVPLLCAGARADEVWLGMLKDNFVSLAISTCLDVIEVLPKHLKLDAYMCAIGPGQLVLPNMFTAGHGMFGNETRLGRRADSLGQLTAMQRRAVDYLDILTCSGPIPVLAIGKAITRRLEEMARSSVDAFGRSELMQSSRQNLESQGRNPYSFLPP